MTETPTVPQRRIDYVPVADVVPATRNPKDHDLDLIKGSIRRFGFLDAAALDERTGRLIGGHGRSEALLDMQHAGEDPPEGIEVDEQGRWLIPVQRGWASRNDAEAEAALVVLNKATEAGGWDQQGLVALLEDLRAGEDPTLLDLTGFAGELDGIIADLARQSPPDPDFGPDDDVGEQPRLDQRDPVTCPSCAYRWRVGPGGQVEPL